MKRKTVKTKRRVIKQRVEPAAKNRKKSTRKPGVFIDGVTPQPWSPSPGALAVSRLKRAGAIVNPFETIPEPPPGVLPKRRGLSARKIAMDAGLDGSNDSNAWAAASVYNGAFLNGLGFMGYTYLAELAQRPEYRHITETLATEMTRKWIRLKVVNQQQAKLKADRVKQLKERMEVLNVQGAFRTMTEYDGFYGRGHLYIDTGHGDDLEELKTPLGDGHDKVTKLKAGKGFLKGIKAIEPVWCYPARYSANDPLAKDWYNPQMWFCLGKELHASRLLPFVGREVPDLLKPSYSFGGLSLSQMAKPYVDNWLRTRQSVADLIWSFSVMVLQTDLGNLMAMDGQQLMDRIELFANFRTNQGVMLLDKTKEELKNVSTPLAGLHELQSQAQEQMCSVTATPVVKLLGVQPAGLNASSEGELTTWGDRVAAFQEKFYKPNLDKVFALIQIDLWGAVDPDITYEFEPLEEQTAKERAETDKTKMDGDVAAVGAGILDPTEVRQRLASEPDSAYSEIDVEDAPEPPMDPAEQDSDLADLTRDPNEERPGREDGGEGRGDDDRTTERKEGEGRGARERSSDRGGDDRSAAGRKRTFEDAAA